MTRIVASVVFALGIVFAAAFAAIGPAATVGAVSCGPCPATTIDALNLRDAPSLQGDVLLVIPAGASLEWDPTQGFTNGFVAVSYNGVDGFSHSDYMWLFPSAATTTDYLNLRQSASLSAAVLDVMPPGTPVQVLGGPSNGFFSVLADQGTGWAHGDFLDFGGGASTDFAIGAEVIVATDALNLRAGPGLGEDVTWVLATGHAMTVLGAPVSADGYDWYLVDAGVAGQGHVAGEFLAAA
jgi:uncharacterized protein YgiM (DUF1202 family)